MHTMHAVHICVYCYRIQGRWSVEENSILVPAGTHVSRVYVFEDKHVKRVARQFELRVATNRSEQYSSVSAVPSTVRPKALAWRPDGLPGCACCGGSDGRRRKSSVRGFGRLWRNSGQDERRCPASVDGVPCVAGHVCVWEGGSHVRPDEQGELLHGHRAMAAVVKAVNEHRVVRSNWDG